MKLKILNEKSVIQFVDKLSGGLADKKSLDDIFDHHANDSWDDLKKEEFRKLLEEELKEGIKVELEHTDNELVAREIALDHLWEDPMYYTKLATIENESYLAPSTGGFRSSPKKVTVDKKDIVYKNKETPDDLEDSNNQLPIPKEPDDRLKPKEKFGPGDR